MLPRKAKNRLNLKNVPKLVVGSELIQIKQSDSVIGLVCTELLIETDIGTGPVEDVKLISVTSQYDLSLVIGPG